MQGLFIFLHWKILNRRFGICASNKFLSHDSPEINDGRDFISFPWSLSHVQIGLGDFISFPWSLSQVQIVLG
jgi:hypothetical protein